jgi:hypothetical protein
LPAEIGPVLNRVKELARGGLTSLMVLGDFLRRRIAPLQQRSRMACMYTGPNDCCKIARGPGTDFTRAELEVSIQGMTGEAFSLESLVLPSGIKALCEDQALRSVVLASMPTLDEGGLAVRQVGGDPNRGIHIPGTLPDRQQRTSQGPGGSSHGGPAPAGKGKGKETEPKLCHKQSVGGTPARRDDEARGAATARSSQEEGSRSRKLQRGDGSYVGEPAPKRQKTVEAEGQSSSRAPPPPPQQQQPQEIPPLPPTTRRPATPLPPPSSPAPAAGSALCGRPPPEGRGVFGGKGDPPNRSGRLGVARLRVSSILELFFVPFNLWALTPLVCARPLFPDVPTASAGDSLAGGSGPQPASSSPAGKSVTAPAGPPSPPAPEESRPGGPEPEAAPLGSEAAPQEEAARPAATAEVPAAAAAPDATAEAPPAELATEEAVAAAEAAALEVAEVASSAPPPVQEEEPEVVYGRHLLPNPVEIPLLRLLIKAQRAQEECDALKISKSNYALRHVCSKPFCRRSPLNPKP